MIKVVIIVKDEEVFDEFESCDTTLLENAICVRKLEEVKDSLLSMQYKNDLEIKQEKSNDDNN